MGENGNEKDVVVNHEFRKDSGESSEFTEEEVQQRIKYLLQQHPIIEQIPPSLVAEHKHALDEFEDENLKLVLMRIDTSRPDALYARLLIDRLRKD